ncbi:conserved protein of unknown function [Rhodovastum atsumiense]|uniref:Prolyl oligopeptidase family serine peptidase n=1 Tax=Rhodovastum atsumiense TaxID=504468 RepID=A0A5M6ITC6_9PROT|nr:PHB depolymerase family esterase [Rhodovastum atsumiense]KAA5610808.1 hypothetical protein F1189_17155 [Rhodovastum atsumiense]CAH2602146.1 conserved protein of unknown function [Rhodovastum atsumiense]
MRAGAVLLALLALAGCATGGGRVGVVSGGTTRSYMLVAPPAADDAPRPLVIALHGWLGSPEQMARMSGLSAAAARYGFVVAYPRGEWHAWAMEPASRRGAADAAFLAQVVAEVSAVVPIAPSRIYAVGFSSGGFMAQALACSGRVRLAGLAVVASGLPVPAATGCVPGTGVPFLLIQGSADPIVPMRGIDTQDRRILPTWDTLGFWAARNQCQGLDHAAGAGIRRTIGRACRDGDTEAWIIDGAGHGWPGSSFAYPAFLAGPRATTPDATSILLDFLLRQRAGPNPVRVR